MNWQWMGTGPVVRALRQWVELNSEKGEILKGEHREGQPGILAPFSEENWIGNPVLILDQILVFKVKSLLSGPPILHF